MVKIKIDLEKILLAAFFALILFLGPGLILDHKIKHDYPFAYASSDSFQHQTRADGIKDAGNFKFEAKYIIKGFDEVVGVYPPGLYHLAVALSYAAGIEVYDAIYFIVVFFIIIAIFANYFIIKNFNASVALISLPVTILAFSYPVSAGIFSGHWPSLLSQSLLFLLFWSVMRLELDKMFIVMAVALSGIALVHTSEAIFGFLFLGLLFLIKLISRKLEKKDIVSILLAFAVFFILFFYYLVIFQNSWAKSYPYSFYVEPVWKDNPAFYIMDFGLLIVFMAVGLIFSFTKELKNLNVAVILAISMLIGGFLNYIGFGLRSFQVRFFWPIYLSVLIGLGIYIIFKSLLKKWNSAYTLVIFSVLVILSIGLVKLPEVKGIPIMPQLNNITNPGLMDPLHWEALNWIEDNTQNEAKVYFFYGDIYSQDALLRNSKRMHYQVDADDFIKSLQNRQIKRIYVTEFPGDTGGMIVHRESFFKFVNYLANTTAEFHFGPRDICDFDYYVFDKASRQEVLAQYNILIANELIKKSFVKPVFENQFIVILKNNNPGEDCIEERKF